MTVEGYFKPEEWTDKDNVNHNTIKLVATKFFEMKDEDKSDETPAEQPKEEAFSLFCQVPLSSDRGITLFYLLRIFFFSMAVTLDYVCIPIYYIGISWTMFSTFRAHSKLLYFS